jgi:hypothetical protein
MLIIFSNYVNRLIASILSQFKKVNSYMAQETKIFNVMKFRHWFTFKLTESLFSITKFRFEVKPM